MTQLTNFIPGTTNECRAMLKKLRKAQDGMRATDRYGREERLSAEEAGTLAALIEAQIWERPSEDEPAEPEGTEKKKPSRKGGRK